MLDLFLFLGHAYQAYRAIEDSGIWIWRQNIDQIQEYLEMSLVEKGLLP